MSTPKPPWHLQSRIDGQLVHPGRILLEHLVPFEISQNALASAMGVRPGRVSAIVMGKRAITADTAIRLAEVLGTTPHRWLAIQADYDIAMAEERRLQRQREAAIPSEQRREEEQIRKGLERWMRGPLMYDAEAGEGEGDGEDPR